MRLVIQAKRYGYGGYVSGPDLQKFGGTCYAIHQADVAVVVTTAGFTKQAQEYAKLMGIKRNDHAADGVPRGRRIAIVSQQKVSKTAGTRCHPTMLPGRSVAADALNRH